jgi:hypothetical protein
MRQWAWIEALDAWVLGAVQIWEPLCLVRYEQPHMYELFCGKEWVPVV